MADKTYSEKLKDPRWQKLRLEVLSRDEFSCQNCGDTESTLHVHHICYNSKDPWEADVNLLITLCETCHESESESLSDSIHDMIKIMKQAGCMSNDFHKLAQIFININPSFFRFDPSLDILRHIIETPDLWRHGEESYFNSLKDNKTKV